MAVQSASCHLRQQPVLEAVTFLVCEKELICVLGPHDSGKTTLLQAIAG
ncbi:MAG: hypothetical protein ACR5LF_08490 [Symbiopectobacterium sp.]